jgi:NADPH:quinone reductase-like Zn-dependent oxidoreductase
MEATDMSTMRAIVIEGTGGPEVLTLADVDQPVAVNAEFLVKVIAAGVNPIDAKTRSGKGVSAAIKHYPAVLGNDFSGVVISSPYENHAIKPGDEVYGMAAVPRYQGTYAEFVTVPSLSIARKPKSLSHVEAAAVPLAALTAWGMVVEVAKAHEGQRMLIHGASGGVGHFALQFARYFGAYVIATGSTRNVGWLKELGANEVVDYSTQRFEEVIDDVDVVIDLIGNVRDDTGSRSLAVLRPGGLLVNAPSGSWDTLREDAAAAGVRATHFKVAPDGSTLAVVSRLLESGDVRVFVDQVFALEDAAEAHRAVETGHTRGKIVLKVSDY